MGQWEPIGFARLIQGKGIEGSGERSEAEILVRDELCNRRGVMHGGAIMGWADTMGGMTASAALADDQRTATIESKTNFFAPIPKGDTARGVAPPLLPGRPPLCCKPTSHAVTASSPRSSPR